MPRGSRTRKRQRAGTKQQDETTVTVEEWTYDNEDIKDDGTKNPIEGATTSQNTTHPLIPPATTAILDDIPNPDKKVFEAIGIVKPTEMQKYVWPFLLSHDTTTNLIIMAPTGAGKTFTYGGMLRHSQLVLTPTRELTIQVASDLQKLHPNCMALYGGRNDQLQQRTQMKLAVKKPPFVIAATPGRLLDLLQDAWKLTVGTIVLDEADRLATDASLREQVTEIARKVAFDRWILATATWPDTVSPVWWDWLRHPENRTIQVVREHTNTATMATMTQIPTRIQQVLHVCSEHKRRKKLLKALEKEQQKSGLIFFATIQELKATGNFLRKQKYDITMWHGQLSQPERERIRSLTPPFLILATDVAARGIHNENLRFLINYDFPSNLEQYVHRCGRIRGSGVCYSFFLRKFRALAPDLVSLLETSHQFVDPNLLEMAQRQEGKKQKKSKKPRIEKPAPVDHDDEDDPFPELSGHRIALKRAENVSDPSSSGGEDNGEEQ